MIYFHIPFCDSKCFYCNFCSFIYSEKIKEKYFLKLVEEIKLNKNKNANISSIYIGGGTPSSIDQKYIKKIIKQINENFNVLKNAEITIEVNPCSISENKLLQYKKLGINRISFGVQSLNNKCLKIIGRTHTKKQAINAIKLAKKCGFSNINTDVLIGIPNQNYYKLKNTIKILIKLKVQHISCYMLINEKGTKLTNLINNKKVKIISEDKCVKYYNNIFKYLKKYGYNRYEISNFAKKNYECKHNIGYWQLKEYYGFGLSAHSYVDGSRYANTCNIQEYLNNEFGYNKEKLSCLEKVEEMIMLSLRTVYGVDVKALNGLGYDVINEKKYEIDFLVKNKFITYENDTIKICEDKFGVTNQIILKLLP